MKQTFFFLILFLSACSSNESRNNLNNNYAFSNDMKYEDFKINLEKYANSSTYPNIDN